MKRHVLLYGLIGGILITVLQWTEYRFLIVEHSVEIYGALIAATFSILGIWLGLRITRARPVAAADIATLAAIPVEDRAASPGASAAQVFLPDAEKQVSLGITPRELEVLVLISQGLSNKEIAGKLYVSENTVKTHSSRVFDKLGARRRTQAVQFGKQLGLLP